MKRLENKIVVITGVSAGIGRASALLFAEEGATVIGADIDEIQGSEVEAAIQEAGGTGYFVKADVSNQEDVANLFAKAKELGGVDVLFNNAGVEVVKSLQDTTEEEWDRSVSVNLKSVYLCIKYALPQMEKKRKGVIISNSSAAGLVGSFSPSYSAAKGGIISLTKALAVDLGPSSIRVNCICPGAIETPMLERVIKMQGDPKEVRERRLKNYPVGRFGTSEEVAYTALFLASDESSFITGAVLPVDGGFTSR
ncbi:MAG: SDR family NAD(P)-dependent oxidoreductase [Candidatus Thorarchaeota archaeon]|jgi:NAD(P)-dependent dehydrogenase (short-subunit alcohol dehydrogenase family)